jgi:hypothetical protein
LEHLGECKKTLKELQSELLKFAHRPGEKLEACLKAIKFALSNDKLKVLLDRLERQKHSFELALQTLSM